VFFNLENTFGSASREALWFKKHKKSISQSMVGWVETVCEATEFCLRWNRDAVIEPEPQETAVRQGCSLRSYLFNIFVEEVIDRITEGNRPSPVVGELTVPYLMIAEYIAVGSFTTNGLPQGMKQIIQFCKYWGLNKTHKKAMVFKKRKSSKK
jgi:hypothetical protein